MNGRILGVALALLMAAPALFAQRSTNIYDHAEVGAFVNYTRLANAGDTNFFGIGGRLLGFNASPHVALEAEGAYDFQRYIDITSSGNFISTRSGVRMAHFMFGPTFISGRSGPLRLFVTAKGGLINFSSSVNFANQVNSIPVGTPTRSFIRAAALSFSPAGLECALRPATRSTSAMARNNNLRVTVGPVIRFGQPA